jgi:hypothetical protein
MLEAREAAAGTLDPLHTHTQLHVPQWDCTRHRVHLRHHVASRVVPHSVSPDQRGRRCSSDRPQVSRRSRLWPNGVPNISEKGADPEWAIELPRGTEHAPAHQLAETLARH